VSQMRKRLPQEDPPEEAQEKLQTAPPEGPPDAVQVVRAHLQRPTELGQAPGQLPLGVRLRDLRPEGAEQVRDRLSHPFLPPRLPPLLHHLRQHLAQPDRHVGPHARPHQLLRVPVLRRPPPQQDQAQDAHPESAQEDLELELRCLSQAVREPARPQGPRQAGSTATSWPRSPRVPSAARTTAPSGRPTTT
jgi:hypothetical protein